MQDSVNRETVEVTVRYHQTLSQGDGVLADGFAEWLKKVLDSVDPELRGSARIKISRTARYRDEYSVYNEETHIQVLHARHKTDEEIALGRINAIEDKKQKRRKLLAELNKLDKELARF